MAGRGRGYISTPQHGFGRGQATFIRSSQAWNHSVRGEQLVPPKGRGAGDHMDTKKTTFSGVGRGYAMDENNGNISMPSGNDEFHPTVPPPVKYQTENFQQSNEWDWPIADAARFQQSDGNAGGPSAADLGAAFRTVSLQSENTGFNASADSHAMGSQSGGFGAGADDGFGGGSARGGGRFGGGFGGGFGGFGGSSSGGFGGRGFGSGTDGGFGGGSRLRADGFNQPIETGSSNANPFGGGGFANAKKTGSGGGFEDFDYIEHTTRPRALPKDLPPIVKDFYVEDPEITAMHDDEVAALRMALNNISVTDLTGERKPMKPIKTFAQAFRLQPEILEQIEKQGFTEPSPIQAQMWPLVMSGHDVIGIAQTGTGKTMAFLLPILIHLSNQTGSRKGPGCLIISPTRELAQQIHAEVKKFHYKEFKSVCIYGGACRQTQVKLSREGVDIVIACPGRLMDLMEAGVLDVAEVTVTVLDEADRMLDMGFEPDVANVFQYIRPDHQTILTSATWPKKVQTMANKYTKDPFLIQVGGMDLSAVKTVTQQVIVTSNDEKKQLLLDFLTHMQEHEKVIVFVNKKITVDSLAMELTNLGIKCSRTHGDRDQVDRDKAVSDLKHGKVKAMVTTDLTSRGIHIPNVTHVFNYDFPQSIDEYIHRIGRTGRAGQKGVAISLMTRGNWFHSTKLITILSEANQEVPASLLRLSERFEATKLEGGPEAMEPRFRRREHRERKKESCFFDPYTGEAL